MATLYHIFDNEIDLIDDFEHSELKSQGFYWLDFYKEDDIDWVALLADKFNVHVHVPHILDATSDHLPSFYDSTENYELLIIHSLCQKGSNYTYNTRTNTILITERIIITIHTAKSQSFKAVKDKVEQGFNYSNTNNVYLFALFIINTIVDAYLDLKPHFLAKVEECENMLLDMSLLRYNYQRVMVYRNNARKLAFICSDIEQLVSEWRSNSPVQDNSLAAIHFKDVIERAERSIHIFENTEKQVESAIQLHYAALSHKTSEVIQLLTILTALFLPLSLIAGIFGMNFIQIPGAKLAFGFWICIGFMMTIAVAMFFYFKRKKWL